MAHPGTAEYRSGESFERVPVQVYRDRRLDRDNAARYLGRSRRTLEMWAWLRKGPQPHNIGGRVFYYLHELDNYIASPKPSAVDKEFRRMPIAELGLTHRTVSALRSANVIYVGDLIRRSESELLTWPNFGRKVAQ
jgi:hypothetical protein